MGSAFKSATSKMSTEPFGLRALYLILEVCQYRKARQPSHDATPSTQASRGNERASDQALDGIKLTWDKALGLHPHHDLDLSVIQFSSSFQSCLGALRRASQAITRASAYKVASQILVTPTTSPYISV